MDVELAHLVMSKKTALSAFARRDTHDKGMFFFTMGMRRGVKFALPGVTEERIAEHVDAPTALRAFAAMCGLQPHEFNVESQRVRLIRMEQEWMDEQRTRIESE